ncbi:integral membrane protein [Alternaria alternata]|nr:integral membrane protein [Alternaria alternata]
MSSACSCLPSPVFPPEPTVQRRLSHAESFVASSTRVAVPVGGKHSELAVCGADLLAYRGSITIPSNTRMGSADSPGRPRGTRFGTRFKPSSVLPSIERSLSSRRRPSVPCHALRLPSQQLRVPRSTSGLAFWHCRHTLRAACGRERLSGCSWPGSRETAFLSVGEEHPASML